MSLTATYTPKQLFYGGCEGHKIAVTIGTGKQLAVGTVLGIITATGLYDAYDNGASSGIEVARGILTVAVDTTSAGNNAATEVPMFVGGALINTSALVGSDSNALTDLGARAVTSAITYVP